MSVQNLNPLDINQIFRKLWEQHVMWTRSFIISTASDLGDLNPVTVRLLRNPSDFADALQPFYGNEKANKFKDLLRDHLVIAADLVNAAKAGDNRTAQQKEALWYKNASDIAAFLASINPYWNRSKWETMFSSHLKMTKNEAVYRLASRYQDDIREYDMIETEALAMADYMTGGILKQFGG